MGDITIYLLLDCTLLGNADDAISKPLARVLPADASLGRADGPVYLV